MMAHRFDAALTHSKNGASTLDTRHGGSRGMPRARAAIECAAHDNMLPWAALAYVVALSVMVAEACRREGCDWMRGS